MTYVYVFNFDVNRYFRYPGTTFMDHLLRYEADPDCKMMVMLGEVSDFSVKKLVVSVLSSCLEMSVNIL